LAPSRSAVALRYLWKSKESEEVLAAVQRNGAKITMPLKEQFYGMREFAFEDPEGWVITIAERVN
jgi:uncharacterized glyoxalase superfamily protein PhnB